MITLHLACTLRRGNKLKHCLHVLLFYVAAQSERAHCDCSGYFMSRESEDFKAPWTWWSDRGSPAQSPVEKEVHLLLLLDYLA